MARLDNIQRDALTVRKLGLWFGGAGAVATMLLATVTTIVLLRAPVQQPAQYIPVNQETGIVGASVGAADAPKLFNDMVAERSMRDFLVRCEGYIPQTFERVDYHSCMIMATTEEQKRREADIGKDGPRYPVKLFGPKGWAMPTQFLAFTKLTEGPQKTLNYEVRYERTEVSATGVLTRPRYTAKISFQWHPELTMDAQDRLLNPSGFLCTSFSTTKDGGFQ